LIVCFFFFFFQAEDGIRDLTVTGVQTCALPISSKATGYPIARVAAKIAVGRRLDEITNAVTGKTTAAFEPTLDYCVVKIPRFPFDKFPSGDRSLGTQMKATGEVMAIERRFPAALNKAIRSLEIGGRSSLWEDRAWG